MPRTARHAPGGYVYHVLNRAVGRHALFRKDADYAAFERVIGEALAKHPIRMLACCLMPNHWHFVLWPSRSGQLTEFVRWLTHTHTMRWHAHHGTRGRGPVYQGRFKSFPIEADDHLYAVLRYVERNPLRARRVRRAEDWPWSSYSWRARNDERAKSWLHPWPVPMPANWPTLVHEEQSAQDLEKLRRSVNRGAPYGSAAWQARIARRLGLMSALRPRGRPRKTPLAAEK